MSDVIDAKEYANRRDLKKEIMKSWNSLTLDQLRLHIDDLFDKRVDKVIATGGQFID